MHDIFAVYFIIVKEYHVRRALLDFFAQSRKQLGRDGVVRIKDDEIVPARILKRSLSRESYTLILRVNDTHTAVFFCVFVADAAA